MVELRKLRDSSVIIELVLKKYEGSSRRLLILVLVEAGVEIRTH